MLGMLRAGAVGYLVKGAAADDIVESIHRVANGRASVSADVMDGIVLELSSQLRREEIEQQHVEARAAEIRRFSAGEGLAIHVQPIMDLETREPVGFEALARFRSLPPRPPDEWFAEAAALELGVQLELAAIDKALRLLPGLPPSSYLSLNCSHRAVGNAKLPRHARAARRTARRRDHRARAGRGLRGARGRACGRCATLGVRIAIDDAGAGYANLRHTLALDPDIVKVDISLTRAIDRDRARRALASALISFADEMAMTIVAEGIETEEELRTLRMLGVRYGQGFHLASRRRSAA